MSHVNENEFGILVKAEGIGNMRVTKIYSDRHDAKSKAGKIFHLDFVKSVCVFDGTGTSHLYLKRNPDGSVTREELLGAY